MLAQTIVIFHVPVSRIRYWRYKARGSLLRAETYGQRSSGFVHNSE